MTHPPDLGSSEPDDDEPRQRAPHERESHERESHERESHERARQEQERALRRRALRRRDLAERVRLGARVGAVAAALTAGALVGFGIGQGAPLGAFGQAGRALLPAGPESPGSAAAAVCLGVLHHAAVVALWGVLFALVAARVRGLRLLAAAALFGAAAYVVDPRVLPDLLRFGHAIAARTSQFVVLCALLSLGLAAGMRLARGSTRLT